MSDIGREFFRSHSNGSATLADASASVDIAQYIGRRQKLFRTQDACSLYACDELPRPDVFVDPQIA